MKAKTQQMKLWPARERVLMIDDMERDAMNNDKQGVLLLRNSLRKRLAPGKSMFHRVCVCKVSF